MRCKYIGMYLVYLGNSRVVGIIGLFVLGRMGVGEELYYIEFMGCGWDLEFV